MHAARANKMYMSAITKACVTGSSSVGALKVFQSLTTTKSIVTDKRSHKDFYSIDSGGSLHKGD
jgi:hypothetical protein